MFPAKAARVADMHHETQKRRHFTSLEELKLPIFETKKDPAPSPPAPNAESWPPTGGHSKTSQTPTPAAYHWIRSGEPWRPKRHPYRSVQDLERERWLRLLDYAQALTSHLERVRSITLEESYYLYYVELDLPAGLIATRFRNAWRACKIVDLPPLNWSATSPVPTHPSIAHAKRLPWTVLPAGKWRFSDVRLHFAKLSKIRPDLDWDLDRLDFAEELDPSECWIGNGEFNGYVCFTFKGSPAALLDHPIVGNACYILRSNWKSLSQLSKHELLSEHQKSTVRVIHTSRWKSRVRSALHRAK